MTLKVQINRCLDLRHISKNNTFPVCIRLYYKRRYDYVKTGVFLTETEYEDLFSSKIKPSLKELLKAINKVERIVSTNLNSCTVYDIGYQSEEDKITLKNCNIYFTQQE